MREVPEVVVNVVNYALVHQVSLTSTEYAKGVNEFIKGGLTELASVKVRPARVKESPVQLECKVLNIVELGQGGGAGNLVICEIVMIHIDKNILDPETQMIDQNKIDLVSRLGVIGMVVRLEHHFLRWLSQLELWELVLMVCPSIFLKVKCLLGII